MTTRLYYTDPLLTVFDATVRAAESQDGRSRVVLDRTAFYPTSGGQPHDTGQLGDCAVVDVVDREDGEVEHVVDGTLSSGQTVRGRVDWVRRFDHMQQHTGQHVLSAAFEQVCGARTISFHLGRDGATIDLHREVAEREIGEAERLANRVVWESRSVTVRFVSEAEAAELPLRKEPSRSGELRLIEVADFDVSACGGTHVPDTGRIGVIAVSGWERFKGVSRVGFVCGGRALAAHGRLREVVARAGRALSVGEADVVATIDRLLAEQKDQARKMKRLHEAVARYRGVEMRSQAETIGPYRVVLMVDSESGPPELRAMASAAVSEPGLLAILIGGGRPAPVVVARSADVSFDAGVWLRAATETLGGRGGGRADLAQGGIDAEPDRIVAFVRQSAWT